MISSICMICICSAVLCLFNLYDVFLSVWYLLNWMMSSCLCNFCLIGRGECAGKEKAFLLYLEVLVCLKKSDTYDVYMYLNIRGVSWWFPENRNIKKTDRVATFSIFSFCQYGRQRSSRTSGSALITAGAPWQSSPPCYFSCPHLSSYRRPPERDWRRPALSSPPPASQTVRTLSQTVKGSRPSSLQPPHTSW
jgi:hypothetical protein